LGIFVKNNLNQEQMKALTKILSVMMVFLFAVPTQAQHPKDEYTRKGDKVMVTRFYEDGAVREQGTFANNVADGRWVEYNRDGSVKIEAFYANGKKEGKWFVYADEGQVMYELMYADNYLQSSNRWKLEENNVADK